jgi:hypothetical protein
MVEYLVKRARGSRVHNVRPVLAKPDSPNLLRPVDLVLNRQYVPPHSESRRVLRGLKASLASGGRVAIVDFKEDAPDGPPPHFRVGADQIAGEMRGPGFEFDAKHDLLPRQHFLVFKVTKRAIQPRDRPPLSGLFTLFPRFVYYFQQEIDANDQRRDERRDWKVVLEVQSDE